MGSRKTLTLLLSGRYVEIEMLPLSFKEYVNTRTDQSNLSRLYRDYLQNSSFPLSLQMENPEQIKVYLQGVYNTVLMNAFIVYQAKRYDCKGKQYLKTLKKYYVVDIGVSNS